MYSDDSGGKGDKSRPEQDQRKKTLKWLLEQDMSEQKDKLFKLADDGLPVAELSESETAVAGRHMMGGTGNGDDLSAFVDEEIVLSEDTGSDIYSDSRKPAAQASAPGGSHNGFMAVDHRRPRNPVAETNSSVADGSDILGLLDDDDIGAQPLALQRNRRVTTEEQTATPSQESSAVPVDENASPLAQEAPMALDLSAIEGTDPGPFDEPAVADSIAGETSTIDTPEEELAGIDFAAIEVEVDSELAVAVASLGEDLEVASAESDSLDQPDSNCWDALAETSAENPVQPLNGEAVDGLSTAEDWSASAGEQPLETAADAGEYLGVVAESPDPHIEAEVSEEGLDLSELAASMEDVATEDSLADVSSSFEELPAEFEGGSDWLTGAIADDLTELEPAALEDEDDSWLTASLEDEEEPMDLAALAANLQGDEIEPEDMAQEPVESASVLAWPVATAVPVEPEATPVAVEQPSTFQNVETEAIPEVAEVAADMVEVAGTAEAIEAGLDEVGLNEKAEPDAQDLDSAAEDVFTYVNRYAPPTDDSEFDRYLLEGGQLADSTYDFDALEVERTEGVVSVDPSLDSNLDYHQDFSLPQDFNPATVATLTRVLAPVMEQISAALDSRTEELGLPEDSVLLDAMLATDPMSRSQSVDEGFLPVAQVYPQLPAALLPLQQDERDAFCVRLAWRDSGHSCNALFTESFEVPALEVEEAATADSRWMSPLADSRHRVSFDFNLDGASASSDFAVDSESANDSDSPEYSPKEERVWSLVPEAAALPDEQETAGESVDLAAEDTLPPVDALEAIDLLAPDDEPEPFDDLEVFAAFETSDSAEPFNSLEPVDSPEQLDNGLAATETNAWQAPDDVLGGTEDVSSPELVLDDAGEDAEPQEEIASSFSDDDLDDWDEQTTALDDVDVDALFDSLGGGEADIEDICGIALDEFEQEEELSDPTTALPESFSVSEQSESPEAPAPVSPEREADATTDMAWCIPSNIRFNYTNSSGTEVFRDFLEAFLEEGAVEIEKLEDAIGQWEQDIDSPAGEMLVPRILHTLKGIAKGIGLQRYGTLIHNFETLLEGLARPEPGAEESYFRIVNAWLDAAVNGFAHIQDTETDVSSELPLAEGVVQPLQQEDAADSVDSDSPVHRDAAVVPQAREKQQDKRIADEGAKALAAQQTIRMTSEALDHLLNLNNQAQQLGVRASQSNFRGKRSVAELGTRLSSVRSHISKIADRALQNVTARGGRADSELDALEMDRYSELQEAASILREAVEDLDDLIHVSSRQTASTEALLKQQAAVISSLGTSIRDARVVPVSRLMPGLRRIVRTVGADLGKQVNFRVLNEIGKLDRDSHVCCQIILEHMVRNALDHGIESPEQRREAGKTETGLVSIDVRKDGSDYLIRLADDGRGIDPEVIREVAIARGLEVNASELSDQDALRLIFHKGFSTAAKLSEISGRGVGMDIVISELQQIGGDIEIDSIVGEGTTFTVRVPSNVNVNGALLVKAGEASYAVPLDGLVAVEQVPVAGFYQAITGGTKLDIFELECEPAYLATICNGDKLPDPGSWVGDTVPVIVAGNEERYMAIAVDDVEEALELVIRSLGAQFAQVPGVAGGATTSDGQAIVALDLNALVRSIASNVMSAEPFEREKSERLLVLVVDDSRTQRMVATNQLDSIGVETVTAENGMVAIDLLNTTHRLPDIVLLDVEMPVKDGIQTLREIRKSARYKHLPVIMVTSRTGPKHRALAQEAGCNGYMGKPFNFPVLVEQISQLTGYKLQIN
ncbi:response regulator [Parahaliea maris]|uniref:Chemotaxis protein CheA n=1 Tax=Parahaliea maris TaxID=2716870 RepID=A0A5C9A0X9_9GAMM|nr:response regulator [Parahaliea maris]TXS93719.1 response regulator [Parahaliea maris]